MTDITKDEIEAAARKITESRGVSPNSLFEIHVFTGDEPFDVEDQQKRRFIYAWRKNEKAAEAALRAAAAARKESDYKPCVGAWGCGDE